METELKALRDEVSALKDAVMLMAKNKGERLTSAQVVERIGRTRQTITSMMRRGEFPKPCDDGRWLLSEIMEWETERRSSLAS